MKKLHNTKKLLIFAYRFKNKSKNKFNKSFKNKEKNQGFNNKKFRDMKRYFLNGKQITEQEAKTIEARNQEYLNSGDWDLIAKCEFVVVI